MSTDGQVVWKSPSGKKKMSYEPEPRKNSADG